MTDHGKTTVVNGIVANLTRATNGSFRYYGDFRIQSPVRYHGKKVGLFVISHGDDVRRYVGDVITFSYNDDDLTRSVEPSPDPFSFSQPEPHVCLEFAAGAFRRVDYLNYEKPVSIRGVVRAYESDNGKGGLYFQFDVGYSGDMASVEVITPTKYQGLILHVLVTAQSRAKSVGNDSWKKIGASVAFTVPESTLAWEPWGFTPLEQLQSMSIDAP